MKNEKTIACKAKTMKDGFNIWKNYLSKGHRPPSYYVPYRAKSCAPHRTLIKNFEKKKVASIRVDDNINLWLRSKPHVGKNPSYYNSKNPGEIKVQSSKDKAISGDGACTYNSINENYAGHIKSSMRTMKRYCRQIYDDITTDDPSGVHKYLHRRPGYEKVKHLLNYGQVTKNIGFYYLITD